MISFVSLLVINAFEFRGRRDDYIFRSDFLVTLYELDTAEVEKILIAQGYSTRASGGNLEDRVFSKEILFETGIGAKVVEKHSWSALIKDRPGAVAVYFFIQGTDSFDGRQIAYRAALDFVNKLDAKVKRQLGGS